MTTETQPAYLLAPLRMVAINIRENLESLPSIAEDWADKLDAAIASLAAHRGEAALWVHPEQLAAARHDIAQHRMSYVRAWNTDYPPEGATLPLWTHPPQAQVPDGSMTVEDAVNAVAELFPGADKQALRVLARALTKKPQAQAGAGDAWVSIADRLPACRTDGVRSDDVLVFSAQGVHVGCAYFDWKPYEKEYWKGREYKPRLSCGGTHWQPLPAPPALEAK